MISPDQRAYRSSFVTPAEDSVDIFWSYTVCDTLGDWGPTNVQKETLGGATILVTTPQHYFYPYNYKRNELGEVLSEPGEEYWNNSIPFEGAMVEYLDQLQTLAKGDFNVEWTFGSKSSMLIHPNSPYTASVQDVQDGLVDMALGPIWVTGERLRMSTYTVPLYYSPQLLMVPAPGKANVLWTQTSKVLAPFEMGAWVMIVLVIALTAILSTWFSGEFGRRLRNAQRSFRTVGRSESTPRLGCFIWGRLVTDEALRMGTYFASAGIEQDTGASLPAKLLLFGFASFTLVVVSAYVANLAAFLTRDVKQYVGTIEAATKKEWKICALPWTKDELVRVYPDTRWVFTSAGTSSYDALLNELDAGKCKAIVDGFPNLDLRNKLCERKLVITRSVVMENSVAWPIRTDYVAGLSYWIYEAEKKHGLKLDSIKKRYEDKAEQPKCNVLDEGDAHADEDARISATNLFFPCFVFGAYAIVAICLQICARMKEGHRLQSMVGRSSAIGFVGLHTANDRSEDDVAQDILANDGKGQLTEVCTKEEADTVNKRAGFRRST